VKVPESNVIVEPSACHSVTLGLNSNA
jgi:hypothetical protein